MSYAIEVFSNEWWINNAVSISIMGLLLYTGNRLKTDKDYLSKLTLFIGVFFILRLFWNQWYQYHIGQWDTEWSLPLQLCSFSSMLSGILPLLIYFNINKRTKQIVFEFLFYWSVGAVYAFLTPQYTHGTEGLIYYDYYVSHGGIVFVALFCITCHGFKVSRHSWFKVFAYSQILLLFIHGINRYIGGKANYFYTVEPPIADNPLVMGEFPFHIIMLDIFALCHFFLFYVIFSYYRKSQIEVIDETVKA